MKKMGRFISLCCLVFALVCTNLSLSVCAKGAVYTEMNDVYYALDGCKVYAEPTYTSTVLTEIAGNVPVHVIGRYSNGWFRINIGVIAYCKMDSLTTTGDNIFDIALTDPQTYDAMVTAQELGYEFHALTLNKEKTIEKDIFNSYVGEKVILYAKIDDQIAVSFKMIYADEVAEDVILDYDKTYTEYTDGSQTINLSIYDETQLLGQIAIFQIRVGYDKAADIYVWDLRDGGYNLMNTYYTEFSQFAYAPVTQVSDMMITHYEIENSLKDSVRKRMAHLRKGIKYLDYDTKEYRNSIHNKLSKDTEYVDYE